MACGDGRAVAVTWLAIAMPWGIGCSSSTPPAPITVVRAVGIVTYQGRPVSNAQMTFHSDKASESGFALTDANGKFRCMTNDSSDGVAPGDYVVSITCSNRKIPQKYTDPELSPILLTVEVEEPNEFKLELDD
jgi:hypothetical protein